MYSSYCRYSLLCTEIICVCMLWIINVSQYSAMPSALAQRKGRQIRHEHRHSHIQQAFSKQDWLQHGCVVWCWICSVASDLDWFPHSDQTSLLDQSEDSITSFLYKQNHFCMDDVYVQCYWICRRCHCFCCKCLALGFDITARSSSLQKRCQISAEIFVGRQSRCHGIRKYPTCTSQACGLWKLSLLVTLKLFYLMHSIGVWTLPALLQA